MKDYLDGKMKISTKMINALLEEIDPNSSNASFIISTLIIQRLSSLCDDIMDIKKSMKNLELNNSNNRVFSRILINELQRMRKQNGENRRSTDKDIGKIIKGKKINNLGDLI